VGALGAVAVGMLGHWKRDVIWLLAKDIEIGSDSTYESSA
jgi:hypothetical protein